MDQNRKIRLDPEPTSGSARVIRGSSWNGQGVNCVASDCDRGGPDSAYYSLSLRLTFTPEEPTDATSTT